jgi:hypothetical protein
MSPKVALGLRLLLEGKIVLLEGPGHPVVLEELLGQWKTRTLKAVEVGREGRTQTIYVPGGSVFHLSMYDLWSKGTFSEEKGQILAEASQSTCLAISHLGLEVPQAYRQEIVRMLVISRIEKINRDLKGGGSSAVLSCAILGVDGGPATFRKRYGEDLADMVVGAGAVIETP